MTERLTLTHIIAIVNCFPAVFVVPLCFFLFLLSSLVVGLLSIVLCLDSVSILGGI